MSRNLQCRTWNRHSNTSFAATQYMNRSLILSESTRLREHVRLGNNSEHVSCRPGRKFVCRGSPPRTRILPPDYGVVEDSESDVTKLQTDAVARAHGVPVTLLPADWTAMMTEFKRIHGTHAHDDEASITDVLRKLR